MTIKLLVGDNAYQISQQINECVSAIDPAWRSTNYQTFKADALAAAVATARTVSFSSIRVVIVRDCGNFSRFTQEAWEVLQHIDQIPANHVLIFVGTAIDRRLKVIKHLLKYGTLIECPLIAPWQSDRIEAAIKAQSKTIGLSLPQSILAYLAAAIGNDQTRSQTELTKLKLYSNTAPVTLSVVEALVPCTRQTTFQLAEAIRTGNVAATIALFEPLIEQADHPLVIIASLISQFRTWLWVKAAIRSGMNNNTEIARICEIGNPNRLYFIRQEIAPLSINALIRAIDLLVEMDHRIKQSKLKATTLLPKILQVTALFQL